ncbi:type II RES/Xre toxin-antitoxin system antitoxin [Undibacterium squillarum]|uniref:type II RES/Xre toxin-antitoxin system antitoxin n=1 Tax=Undibacterium squillarum TaxID=1131567 RepID=UPI0035B26531
MHAIFSSALPQPHAARSYSFDSFDKAFTMPAMEKIELVEHGVKASDFKKLVEDMGLAQEELSRALRISVSTINRKVKRDEILSIDESERVLNMASLIGQVSVMVAGADTQFNAAQWVASWIEQPLPALGGRRPVEFLGTSSGFQMVANVLRTMQSGAYL